MEQMNEKCPIEIAISVIGIKWKVQILRELVRCEKPGMRFTDFKKSITGISDKMLSQSLKELERDHLVDRKLIDDSPPEETGRTGKARERKTKYPITGICGLHSDICVEAQTTLFV